MLKGILAFLILSAVALGQCSQYVDIAQNYLSSGSCYPNCFPAAQEYLSAAKCYESIGDANSAGTYYLKAAQNFVEAPSYLVQSGDYRLAGKSYEYAADSYAKIGSDVIAAKYYQKARELYADTKLYTELAALEAKLAPSPVAELPPVECRPSPVPAPSSLNPCPLPVPEAWTPSPSLAPPCV